MRAHAAIGVIADDVEGIDYAQRLGGDAGFLLQFARGGGDDGLADLLHAAGEAPFADRRAGTLGALRQKHAILPPASAAQRRGEWPVGIVAA